jgi:type IX secretion system substrate protein/beta-propeller repeat-containing protein
VEDVMGLRRIALLILSSAFLSLPLRAQLAQTWESRYNGTAAGAEGVEVSAADPQGNLYAAGTSLGPGSYNPFTIKYDSLGNVAWTAVLDGPEDRRDIPISIAAGGTGNVFVCLNEDYPPGAGSMKTVKFNSSGGVEWKHLFDKGENVYAFPLGMALDDSENVFVCGSVGGGTPDTAVIVMYAADGSLRWTRAVTLPHQLRSDAEQICADSSGDVYVVGRYEDDTYGSKGFLAKFAHGGNLLWFRIFDLAGPNGTGFASLRVGGDRRIIVSGFSDNSFKTSALILNYTSQGDFLWSLVYDDGAADLTTFQGLELDHEGNSYLTGFAQVSDSVINEFITISVDSSGHLRWEGRYHGAYNGNEQANALALDASGNVYVVGAVSDSLSGNDVVVLKYSNGGNEEWARITKDSSSGYSEGKTANVSPSGMLYVGGTSQGVSTGYDGLVLSYSGDGTELWKRRYNTTTSAYDQPRATTVDDSGNVIVTGSSSTGGSSVYNIMSTVKFGMDGSIRWVAKYPDSGSFDNRGQAITHDKEGNIYVAGEIYSGLPSAAGSKNLATLKYAPDGSLIWSKVFVSPGGGYDNGIGAIAVDDSGNVITAGGVKWDPDAVQSTATDFTVIKYAPDGSPRWVSHYDHSGGQEGLKAMVLDDSGNVYVTGFSQGLNAQYDYATVKFARGNGDILWAQRFDGRIHGEDYPYGMAIDDSGNVYVTGFSSDSIPTWSAVTIKYDRAGRQLWLDRFALDSLAHGAQNIGWQVALDNQYRPVVGVLDFVASHQSALVKYSPDGVRQWRSTPTSLSLQQMILDGSNSAYCTAVTTPDRPVITRFESSGAQSWVFTDTSLAVEGYMNIAFDGSGNIDLSIEGKTPSNDHDYVVAKYLRVTDHVRTEPGSLPLLFRLYDAYPNPFNPQTTIRYALPARAPVVLKVFDLLGEEVATLVNEVQEAGLRHVEFNASGIASGVYFYRLQAGPFTGVKKIVLLK